MKLPESSKLLPQFHLASPAPILIGRLENHNLELQGEKSAIPKLNSTELNTPAKTQVCRRHIRFLSRN